MTTIIPARFLLAAKLRALGIDPDAA